MVTASATSSCFDFGRTSPAMVAENVQGTSEESSDDGVLEITADFLIPPERFLKNRVANRFIRLVNGGIEIHKSEKACRRQGPRLRFVAINDVTNVCLHFMPVGSKKNNFLCIMTQDETFNIYIEKTTELKEWYEAVMKQLIRIRSERQHSQVTRFDFYMMAWNVTITTKPQFATSLNVDEEQKNRDITLNQPYLLTNGGKHRFALMTNQKTIALILRGLSDDVEIPPDVRDKLINGNELRIPFSVISFHTVFRNYVTIRFGRSSILGGGVAWMKVKTRAEARRIFNSIRAWARFNREEALKENNHELQANPTANCQKDVVHYEELMREFFEADSSQIEPVSPPPMNVIPDKRPLEPKEEVIVPAVEVLPAESVGNDYKSAPTRTFSNSSNGPAKAIAEAIPPVESVVQDAIPAAIPQMETQPGYAEMTFAAATAHARAKQKQPVSVCSYASGSTDSFMSPTVRSNAASFNDRQFHGDVRAASRTSAKSDSEASDDSRARAHSMSTAERERQPKEIRPRGLTAPAKDTVSSARRQADHEMFDFTIDRSDALSNSSNRKSVSRQSTEFRSPSSSLNAGVGSRKASASKQRPTSAADDAIMASDTDGYLPMTYSDASTISLPHRPKTGSNISNKSFPRRSIEDLTEEKDDYVLTNTPIQKSQTATQPLKLSYMETISEGGSPSIPHRNPKHASTASAHSAEETIEYATLEFGDGSSSCGPPDTPNSDRSAPRAKLSVCDFSDYSEITPSGTHTLHQHFSPKKSVSSVHNMK
ncbi:hypothetical protein L596_014909 [Steinernema carpocapsae]|uniref:IRS-type PTB domain-containing protein n=1 Tax=Steinernema carpocapsae TaxID=34508 RepID=A0A4U5NE76_STECR|nr:hypothetical protein L596_014909 [Steinernema carpocapsae]